MLLGGYIDLLSVTQGQVAIIDFKTDAPPVEGVENAQVIGEFAFGTSEKAPFGTPSEKGRIGTVHLALGDNHNAYPGGQNVSALHLDGVFLNATLQIVDDGTYILKDGEWAL